MDLKKRPETIKEILISLVEETTNIDSFKENEKIFFGISETKEKPKKKRKKLISLTMKRILSFLIKIF